MRWPLLAKVAEEAHGYWGFCLGMLLLIVMLAFEAPGQDATMPVLCDAVWGNMELINSRMDPRLQHWLVRPRDRVSPDASGKCGASSRRC